MIEMTTQEIADKLGIQKDAAYGLVTFLAKAGLTNDGSGRKPVDGRGKGTKTYLIANTMPEAVRDMLAKLTTGAE